MADGLALLRRQLPLRPPLTTQEARGEGAADRPISIQLKLGADIADDEANEGHAEEAHVGDDEKRHDRRKQPGRKGDGDEDGSCGHVLPPGTAVTPTTLIVSRIACYAKASSSALPRRSTISPIWSSVTMKGGASST